MSDAIAQSARWRFFITGRDGTYLSTISKLAKDRKLGFRRNRPSFFTFRVPSDDPQITVRLTDGFPTLTKQLRAVKGYRWESVDHPGYPGTPDDGKWKLRGAFIVWQTQDKGDINGNAWTQVTCYSPLILLEKYPPATGTVGQRATLTFDGETGDEIIIALINQANEDAGF